MTLENLLHNEEERIRRFPIAKEKIFLGHAAVTALPLCAAEAMAQYAHSSSKDHQEFPEFIETMNDTRRLAADLIGAKASEIALLGPTSLGLSLFANGIDWRAGDEVLCYQDDYPANVYPWVELQRKGVKTKFLEPEESGTITPELVESSIGPATRLVALASCHYLTGYRIDIDTIGKMLRERGILFALDGIQTCGAFPTPVQNVDFMSCDAHKWLLGPMAIGIVYVKQENFEMLRPTLLGAWNVHSPDYITQEKIKFHPTARRYEPGVLNASGIVGFKTVLELINEFGMKNISSQLLKLKSHLINKLESLGFSINGPKIGNNASSITTFKPSEGNALAIFDKLTKAGIICSCRKDRSGEQFLRFSPHFYNTETEIDRTIEILTLGTNS